MTTAPRSEQLILLDVADLDAKIAKLQAEDAHHPLRTELGEIVNLIVAKSREIADAEVAERESQKRLREASAVTEKTSAIIDEKEARLHAGEGMDSRQLLTLQSEVDQHRAMLDEQTDVEFAALEEVERLGQKLEQYRSEQLTLNEKMVEIRAELEDVAADFQREIDDLQTLRDAKFAPLSESLKVPYERARERGAMPVIAMHPNGRSTGGVEISPIEVAQIKNSDPDHISFSDDYGCIIVLLDS